MIKESLAQPAHQSTRLTRGIKLAEDRFEEIHRIKAWVWEVPSCSGAGTYTVNLKHSTCSCPDRPKDEECKHLFAARFVKARTAKCSGCGRRSRHRELYSVPEDNLTYFPGELLCRQCGVAHGVL